MDQLNDIPSWVMITGNFGFPIVITLYLLIRFENKLENLESAIQNLIEVIKNWGIREGK